MKINTIIIILFSILLSNSHNPPNNYVGIENNIYNSCYQCHTTYYPNTEGQVNIFGVPLNPIGGETYIVDITVENPYAYNWGFEIAVIAGVGGRSAQAGILEVIDSETTISEVENGITYIKQTSLGTFLGQPDSATWSVFWTAPDDYYGSVIFHVSGVAGNNSQYNLGDYSYLNSKTVSIEFQTEEYENLNYYADIQPILNAYCVGCHLQDEQYNNNGLILENYDFLMEGGNNGPSIIPFDSDNSLLYKTITGTSYEDLGIPSMPYFAPLIPEYLREKIRVWINEGANEIICVSGDYNFDLTLDVLDIVLAINCILEGNCNITECTDYNNDFILDVLDIVGMVQGITDR